MLYEKLLRPWLFRMDPERAHEKMINLLSFIGQMPLGPALFSAALGGEKTGLETEAFGLRFPNPIGLAAGFDKDCRAAAALPALGFGFLELGSVTLKPQPGNPKPRIFRIPEEDALINRLGFNSAGADAAAARLADLPNRPVPLGLNIGLNAECSPEDAPAAYAATFKRLAPYGDYFALNVSSPNTTGLRALQEDIHLKKILAAVQEQNADKKPVLVKIDPDQPDERLAGRLAVIEEHADGVIASNTTLSRPWVGDVRREIRGGLSGAPLRGPSTALIRKIRSLTGGRLPIVGVGGVFNGSDAFEKILAGACLVQVYTGLIYRGPAAIRAIRAELSELLARNGFKSVSSAVGGRA